MQLEGEVRRRGVGERGSAVVAPDRASFLYCRRSQPGRGSTPRSPWRPPGRGPVGGEGGRTDFRKLLLFFKKRFRYLGGLEMRSGRLEPKNL